MNLIETIDQYDSNCVFFCDPITNNIMDNGRFIRLIYSTHWFTLNGIYLDIPISYYSIEKFYNKYKCLFDIQAHAPMIRKIVDIETKILDKLAIKNKQPMFKISDQLQMGCIKVFSEKQNSIDATKSHIVLKMSGIWETDAAYGLTFKFIR